MRRTEPAIIVSKSLNRKPSLAFIPGGHFLYWSCFGILAVAIGQYFQLGWIWTGAIAVWLVMSFWIIAGDNPDRFVASLFHRSPKYIRGRAHYLSMVTDNDNDK